MKRKAPALMLVLCMLLALFPSSPSQHVSANSDGSTKSLLDSLFKKTVKKIPDKTMSKAERIQSRRKAAAGSVGE
ncbi:hypothetical protein PACILC2_15780 [Paenibacillus cisolokensis]|uniref:Uncharacterized protein n=1 Tax=Paenibacillus cisolokensis TaxID=1658519 RepID=A0ABQ4N4C6_9BACL|nr:hypothetical protein [Paenibacillus cisolokensis]GIQ63010.1 hypothetical protein PACILC2_15780 [Paenibacillus cisolokensis]